MDHEKSEECSGLRFEPALWRQRKLFACQTLIDNGVTSVIDFGCGEGALTSTLINYYDENNPVTRVAAVDISRECLDQAIEVCQPQTLDLGDHARPFELSLHFFQGSVDAADERLMGYEGLACMEVIEHLDPPVLAGFWQVVLGTYQPKVVVISTPNAEFNVHFPNLRYGTPESTFRHWDHRFEWTRQEFQQWCKQAADFYGYSVEFSGVGAIDDVEPPEGYCSQIAVLKRSDTTRSSQSLVPSTPYDLITTIEYPYYNIEHSDAELLEFLHNRIALIRPLPPAQAIDDDEQQLSDAPNLPQEEKEDQQQQTQAPDQGRLSVVRLWAEFQVQQRVKTRSRLVELLGASPLVRLSEDRSLILYDEADPFWAEFERQYKERMNNGCDEDDDSDGEGYDDWSSQDYEEHWQRPSYDGYGSNVEDTHQGQQHEQVTNESAEELWSAPKRKGSCGGSDGDGWGAPEPDTWQTVKDWKDNNGW
ncbi:Small RNA 2'-O-methyltransferase [Actinomortierella ambigua]|nr:Small RNA 2'-O-methyltransferase [Actinomortierella ambigua]